MFYNCVYKLQNIQHFFQKKMEFLVSSESEFVMCQKNYQYSKCKCLKTFVLLNRLINIFDESSVMFMTEMF